MVLFLFADDKRQLSTLAAKTADGKKTIDVKAIDLPYVQGRGKRSKFVSKLEKDTSPESEAGVDQYF